MLTRQLQDLGLTQGEAKVYEALITLGSSTVGPIVKRSGVAYSNIYEVLQRLADKGLVTHVLREKTRVYNAVPPHRLEEYLQKRADEVKRSQQALAALLPSLVRLQHDGSEHLDAEVFLGQKGLMTAYDILYSGLGRGDESLYFFAHDAAYDDHAYAFYQRLMPRVRQRGIKLRGIGNIEFKKTKLAVYNRRKNMQHIEERYVPFPVPGSIDIAPGKVLIESWGANPIGILIHSEQVARHFAAYFESVWTMAKR